MKKKFKNVLVLVTIIMFTSLIFLKPHKLVNITLFSINIFIKNIFPFLFPMLIISKILIELNIPYYLGKHFNKIIKVIFKTSKYSAFIFFMSMLTGFPSSAKFIEDLINKKLITKNDGQKALTFTFFSNPLFIIGTIGTSFLKSTLIGFYIFISHLIGNILTGIVFRNYKTSKNSIINYEKKQNLNLFNTLSFSIKESLEILINIFGILTFFLIIINFIFEKPNTYLEIFLAGIIEMTSGLKYLSISDYALNLKLYTSVFFLSFGGLSIHFQIFNILNKKKIKYLPFLISRIIHGLLSITILYLILQLDKLF